MAALKIVFLYASSLSLFPHAFIYNILELEIVSMYYNIQVDHVIINEIK